MFNQKSKRYALLSGLFLLNAALFGANLVFMWRLSVREEPSFLERLLKTPSEPKIEYKDFVSIAMTALSVQLALFALFASVLAIWGFTSAKEQVKKWAEDVARNTATEVARPVAAREAMEAEAFREGLGSSEELVEAVTSEGQDNDERKPV